MEEQPPTWMVAANILNKQSWTHDKRLGKALTTPPHKNWHSHKK